MGKTTFITLLAGLFLLHAPTTQAQGTPEKYRGANFTIETGGFVGADKFRVRGFHPFSFTGGYTFDRHWFLGLGFSSAIYYPADEDDRRITPVSYTHLTLPTN